MRGEESKIIPRFMNGASEQDAAVQRRNREAELE